MQQRICYLKGNGKGKSKGNFRYLVLSYLRLEGISDFEGNRPGNHQNSLKSQPGNNKGIKYHRWLYLHTHNSFSVEGCVVQVAAAGLSWRVIALHHCLYSMCMQSIHNSASLRGVCAVQIHHSASPHWRICFICTTRLRLDCVYGPVAVHLQKNELL